MSVPAAEAAGAADGGPAAAPRGERRLPPRVGINAVFLQPGLGGLDTYVQEIVPELVRLAPGVRFSVFCSPVGERHLRAMPWADEVRFVTHPLLGRPGLKAASELTVLGVLAGRRVDLLHSVAHTAPLRTRAVNVVMVADVTWLFGDAPDLTTRLWRVIVPPVARHADRVIAISHAAARDLEHYLHVAPERIDVTLLGHGSRVTVAPLAEAEVRERFALGDGPLVLAVGSRKPHKNLRRLVAALPSVRRSVPGATLVLAGNPTEHDDELRAEAERGGVAEHVKLLGFVAPDELEGLYAAAACVVLPSTNEGFGLPIVEAMARGVPVACSNVSALPEVGGDAAVYFDPLDEADIARAVLAILEQPGLAERLVQAGRRRAATLTWERTAHDTLDSYERAWRERR